MYNKLKIHRGAKPIKLPKFQMLAKPKFLKIVKLIKLQNTLITAQEPTPQERKKLCQGSAR